eukprot:3581428-Pyramimonas_sp.AAC.1
MSRLVVRNIAVAEGVKGKHPPISIGIIDDHGIELRVDPGQLVQHDAEETRNGQDDAKHDQPDRRGDAEHIDLRSVEEHGDRSR